MTIVIVLETGLIKSQLTRLIRRSNEIILVRTLGIDFNLNTYTNRNIHYLHYLHYVT